TAATASTTSPCTAKPPAASRSSPSSAGEAGRSAASETERHTEETPPMTATHSDVPDVPDVHAASAGRRGAAPAVDDLSAAERLSIDELRSLQLERLRWTLRHAYDNVPFYRAKLDAAGVHPDDCREPADLAKFPFTTKQDLRENYPFGMFAVPEQQVSRIHASSGTTGKPTVVG